MPFPSEGNNIDVVRDALEAKQSLLLACLFVGVALYVLVWLIQIWLQRTCVTNGRVLHLVFLILVVVVLAYCGGVFF